MKNRTAVLIRRILGGILLIVAALELRGAFIGDLAFAGRPNLVLTPIHAPNLSDEQIAESRLVLERELAGSGNHALYPKSLIENFYLERDNATDVFDGSYRGADESLELGRSLGVERVALVSIYGSKASLTVFLNLYDVATEQLVGHESFNFSGYEDFLAWTGKDGEYIDLGETIGATVASMSAGAWMYVGWMGLLFIPALILLFGRDPWRGLVETLLTLGLLLALFAWIYALNGDMDYVQRFVATSGSLDIDDTSAERTATLWRYLLPMLLLAGTWTLDLIRRLAKGRESSGSITGSMVVEGTAPILAILSALLYSFAFPNLVSLAGWAPLAWIATGPLLLALRRTSWRRGVGMGILFTGLQALIVNWWQGTFSYISLPFTVGLTLVQYLPFVCLLAATVRFFPKSGFWGAALLWTAFDWVRSLGFLGYPWAILGASQYAQTALIQVSALGGMWAVSLLTHLSGASFGMVLDRLSGGRIPRDGAGLAGMLSRLRPWRPFLVTIAVVLAVTAGGGISIAVENRRMEKLEASGAARKVSILAVQQNTDPRKHDYRLSFEELSRLTEEALDESRATGEPFFDLVAWPESGFVPDVRFWLDEKRARWSRGKLVREMLDWHSATGVNLVTGNQDHFYEDAEPDPEDPEAPTEVKRIQNSALFLRADRTDDYDRHYYYKMRLVPFTENFPYGEQFPKVAELLHNFSTTQWTPGTEHIVFEAPAFRFSTPICFEDVFPDHVRRYAAAGAEVFVNMSNDYWANTPLEGYQHASHAVFRTVENRRPLIRATCSGWTISVDQAGRISDDWPPFYEPGYTIGNFLLPEEPRTTLYNRLGDWLPVGSGIIWVVFCLWEFIFRRRREF